MTTSFPDVSALREWIEASEGARIGRVMNTLDRSRKIFTGNHAELARVLEWFRDSELAAGDVRDELQTVLDGVDRCLHNYVASVKSLVDHTRAVVDREYSTGSFRRGYDERVGYFKQLPAARFVQQLREYVLHNRLPMTRARVRFTVGVGFDNSVALGVQRLLEWENWCPPAREYLQAAGDHLRLTDPVDQYAAAVEELYSWMHDEQLRIHRSAFAEVDRLREEYDRAIEAASA